MNETVGARRAPIHGPGTYNGAEMGRPRLVKRTRDEFSGVTVHEHDVAGVAIRTHRTHRVTPAGWVYAADCGDWHTWGYVRTQREGIEVALGQICRAIDSGELVEP